MKRETKPPQHKAPGLIAKIFSTVVSIIAWMVIALFLSILIEWVGIAWLWPEQGETHSREMLRKEYGYLNLQLVSDVDSVDITSHIYHHTTQANDWLITDSPIADLIVWAAARPGNDKDGWQPRLHALYIKYQHYIHATLYISQLFVVRLAIIVFSLPAFILFGTAGVVDGLTERELRRWGGGRESSNVYNLARVSIIPAFVSACVIYISLPVSINPSLVILPFALLFGLSARITCERLKKYF